MYQIKNKENQEFIYIVRQNKKPIFSLLNLINSSKIISKNGKVELLKIVAAISESLKKKGDL